MEINNVNGIKLFDPNSANKDIFEYVIKEPVSGSRTYMYVERIADSMYPNGYKYEVYDSLSKSMIPIDLNLIKPFALACTKLGLA